MTSRSYLGVLPGIFHWLTAKVPQYRLPRVSQQLLNFFNFFAWFGHLKSSYPIF